MKRTDRIQFVKGIGEKRAELFHKLGVFSVEDLIFHFPRAYEDRTDVRAVSELSEGDTACVRVSPVSGIRSFRARNGARVTQVRMSDGSGVLSVTWFNAPYIEKMLRENEEVVLFGKVSFRGMMPEMVNPVTESAARAGGTTGKIMPIYPCTTGLTQRNIRDAIGNALSVLEDPIPEILPQPVRKQFGFPPVQQAILQIHQPDSMDAFETARQRFAFEEFFILQIGIAMAKRQRKCGTAPVFADVKCIADFAKGLPFTLTNAQKRVINEICADLRRDIPMNRLVQGDVGSGKTMVAACAMFAAARNGYQAVMMAPTEILAKQHYENLSKLFAPFSITVAYLSGGQKAAERRENLNKIADGTADVILGTHALITEGVKFYRLGLAITDEQHRFGVRQRTALSGKSSQVHTLVMTATPIPRTLSLILYGDLDVSIIDELPAGRKKIKTIAISEEKRAKMDEFVLAQLDAGRQAYFICPLIEESEVIEANAVDSYLEKLKHGVYRKKRIAALHGRMKSAEKEMIMAQFVKGEIDALVSTTVIEVGVDVPNASVMVIENAERFGLSQLHQLRGRVGRGSWQSYCVLLCAGHGAFAKERMQVMCDTDDGFQIAEKDLELRGPGDFLGTRQHGLLEMRCGDIKTDMQLLMEAQNCASNLLKTDPNLDTPAYAALKQKVEETFEKAGGILN